MKEHQSGNAHCAPATCGWTLLTPRLGTLEMLNHPIFRRTRPSPFLRLPFLSASPVPLPPASSPPPTKLVPLFPSATSPPTSLHHHQLSHHSKSSLLLTRHHKHHHHHITSLHFDRHHHHPILSQPPPALFSSTAKEFGPIVHAAVPKKIKRLFPPLRSASRPTLLLSLVLRHTATPAPISSPYPTTYAARPPVTIITP